MLDEARRREMIHTIRTFPKKLRKRVDGLSAAQMKTHYLPDEWTIAQNVHHLADSHMNSFIRLKLILTENNPALKPYDQVLWAEQPDGDNIHIETSLQLLDGLHARWATLFESLSHEQRRRTGIHPETGVITPDDLLRAYANHCDAHIDQITRTLHAAK
jgi:hypothetical protein